MIESVLCRRDAETYMVQARKSPGITNPIWQERYDCGRIFRFRQRCAISEGHFHLSGRQRSGEFFRERAVRSVGAHEKPAKQFGPRLCLNGPAVIVPFEATAGSLFAEDLRAGLPGSFAQESIKCNARVNSERFIQLQVQLLTGRRVHVELINSATYRLEQVRPGLQS